MNSTDPRSLLYRQLDPAEAQALAAETLSACEDGELFLQFIASESFAFDDGRLKTADLVRYTDPGKLAVMRKIKAALDPDGILNPGVIFA